MEQLKKDYSNNRIYYLDIAKGIGILCVILGHMGQENIKSFVFTFHMPLFFLISGYFISNKYDLNAYVKNKASQFLRPYVFTCVCILAISVIQDILLRKNAKVISNFLGWLYASLYGSGTNYSTPFYIKSIGAIWFLLASLFALIIVKYVNKFKYAYLYIILLAYIGYKTAQFIWLPFSIQAGLTASLFVYLGYQVKKYNILNKEYHVLIKICIFLIWILSIIFGGHLYMVCNIYENILLNIIGALSGSYIIILISKFIENKMTFIGDILKFYGKNSLIILCFHLIELNMLPWNIIYDFLDSIGQPVKVALIVVLILKICWSTFFVFIVHRISLLSEIFTPK